MINLKHMKILGIETSCDETAAAVLEANKGKFKVLSSIVLSQINIHKKYGGVVPEVAARKHVEHIIAVVEQALTEAKINDPKKQIDYIAVTAGPGLITSLFVGVECAKSLSYCWEKPLVAIDHVKGHIYTNCLEHMANGKWKFPALALVVSGGHTELVLMKDEYNWKKIGETLDDAAGESFDKVAKILDEIIPGEVGYPGGPFISKLAKKGNAERFDLPRPMINSGDLNFSFSGLKTAVLYLVRDNKEVFKKGDAIDVCASFQQAVIDVLVSKTIKAAEKFSINTIMLAGGVAANQELRSQLEKAIKDLDPKINFLMPEISLCGDNATASALAGYFKILKSDFTPYQKVKVDPNMEI